MMENQDKNVAVAPMQTRGLKVQYILTGCCYAVIVISGCAVLGKVNLFGGSAEPEIIPRAIADVTELSYVEDMKVIFGDDTINAAPIPGREWKRDERNQYIDDGEKRAKIEADSSSRDVGMDANKDSVKAVVTTEVINNVAPVRGRELKQKGDKGKPVATASREVAKSKPPQIDGLDKAWAALKNEDYAGVLKICKDIPPNREVQYLKAKAIFGRFKGGQADGKDVIDAWTLVKSRNDLGSKWYNEADSILNLFRR